MNKRKTNAFIHIVVVFLCLLPIVCLLLAYFRSPPENPNAIFQTIQDQWCLSHDIKFAIKDALSAFGAPVNHPIGSAMCSVMSNTLIIHFAWLCVEVMLFIPKFALKIIRRCTDI